VFNAKLYNPWSYIDEWMRTRINPVNINVSEMSTYNIYGNGYNISSAMNIAILE